MTTRGFIKDARQNKSIKITTPKDWIKNCDPFLSWKLLKSTIKRQLLATFTVDNLTIDRCSSWQLTGLANAVQIDKHGRGSVTESLAFEFISCQLQNDALNAFCSSLVCVCMCEMHVSLHALCLLNQQWTIMWLTLWQQLFSDLDFLQEEFLNSFRVLQIRQLQSQGTEKWQTSTCEPIVPRREREGGKTAIYDFALTYLCQSRLFFRYVFLSSTCETNVALDCAGKFSLLL